MNRIMIIAGGTWQVPLIKKAKSLGYSVVNSNLYENSPGFEYADFTAVCDVRDKESNLAIAEKYGVSGVLTDQSDIAVPTVAYVSEKMNCPTIGSEAAELFTNKFKMREFCEKYETYSLEYKLCRNVEEAITFFEALNQKAIIKPLDSQSSRGVFTIHTVEELKEKFQISQSFSCNSHEVLIERFISGKEFTIDGIMLNGKHHSLAISEKSHFEYNKNIASELLFSYDNDKYDYNQLRQQHNELLEKTGLKFGLTHAEYKCEDGKFILIEMAARGGGTRIASDIVPYMSGIDTYQMLIESAIGMGDNQLYDFTIQKRIKERWAVLKFLDIESAGRAITKIKGVKEIKKQKEVLDFALEFNVGDVIGRAQDDRSRVGYYIACANSRKEIQNVDKTIRELLEITF